MKISVSALPPLWCGPVVLSFLHVNPCPFVSICGQILKLVTLVTAPINIGPSPPLRACKISSCYDLETHKTLATIDLLRLLRPLPLNSGSGRKSFFALRRVGSWLLVRHFSFSPRSLWSFGPSVSISRFQISAFQYFFPGTGLVRPLVRPMGWLGTPLGRLWDTQWDG